MNTQNNKLFTPMNEAGTKKMTADVKQTLSSDHTREKHFTTADLWNIQRQKKGIMARRYFA